MALTLHHESVDPEHRGVGTATFKHGVLTLKLPKGAAAKGTKIPIKSE